MKFIYYSDKTVAQCMTALNTRLQTKGAKLEGWVEKNGHFQISAESRVVGKIARRTRLTGKVERQQGLTIIKGSVPSGVDRAGQLVIFGALALVAIALTTRGEFVMAAVIFAAGLALYIPLTGDYKNSPHLLNEVKRTLNAKPTPPKKPTEARKPTAGVKLAKPAPARKIAPDQTSSRPPGVSG